MIPTLLLIITCLAIGAIVGGGIIYVLNDAGIVNKSISAINENRGRLSQAIKPYLRERSRLRKRRNRVRKDLRGLRKSITGIINEIEIMECVWEREDYHLISSKYVNASETIIFGRGEEWVYLYTFPTHENLAHAKHLQRFPMKLGMTTRENVVQRVQEQIVASTTAISERASLHLAFRVNNAGQMEQWMHQQLRKADRQLKESVGQEWFETSPDEIESLFRAYVLQHSSYLDPVVSDTGNEY
jgi:hypothetical protein